MKVLCCFIELPWVKYGGVTVKSTPHHLLFCENEWFYKEKSDFNDRTETTNNKKNIQILVIF